MWVSRVTQMDPNLLSLGSLADAFWQVGRDLRAELGLGVEDFDNEVKKRFDTSIVAFYKSTFEDVLEDLGRDTEVIGTELRKDRGLVHKWKTKGMGWDSLFLALAAYDVEMDGRFPRGRDAVRYGVIESIKSIRDNRLPGSRVPLRKGDIECLYHLTQSKSWYHAQVSRDLPQLERLGATIIERVRRRVPGTPLCDYRDIEDVIEAWLFPWLLFQTAIRYEWFF